MDISVVIPLFNEDESLPELYAWIARVMKSKGFTYEVIFVNDGSTDKSWDVIEQLRAENPQNVKGIKFRRNYGKSPALYCGFHKAEGDVVITMDADLQDSPDEIPELYRMIKEDGYDLVSGYKMNRKQGDPLSKTIPTKLFNATARKVSGIHNLHDFNCGLKAYRKDVVKNIEVYGEMHRYIPYLAKNAGFDKIGEKPVHHQARKFGKSKFMGWNRFFNGYLDLITLWFLSSFGRKPMHVFGFLGTLVFMIGFLSALGLGIDKLWCLANGIPQRLVTSSLLLHRSHDDDDRNAALPRRIPRRPDKPQLLYEKRLSGGEGNLNPEYTFESRITKYEFFTFPPVVASRHRRCRRRSILLFGGLSAQQQGAHQLCPARC